MLTQTKKNTLNFSTPHALRFAPVHLRTTPSQNRSVQIYGT